MNTLESINEATEEGRQIAYSLYNFRRIQSLSGEPQPPQHACRVSFPGVGAKPAPDAALQSTGNASAQNEEASPVTVASPGASPNTGSAEFTAFDEDADTN